MSYNRGGYRQDNQSYRSNMGQYSNQRASVSPWECGVAPNAALSRPGIQSLLPSPPQLQVNSNILTQQQNALVMASNLLSNLGLLPQQAGQHHRSQEQLPSLMNMRTMGNSSYRGPPQHYGSQGPNRYNNLPMRRNKPLDSHRVEPYKNRSRQAASQAQQPGRRPPSKPTVNKDKAANASSTTSGPRAKVKKQPKSSSSEAVVGDSVKSKAVDTKPEEELVAVKGEEEEAKRDENEGEDKKREWKAEKSEGEKMDEEPSEEVDPEEAEEEEEEEKAEDATATDGKTVDKGKFFCHVCNKHLIDEQALKNHLTYKSHTAKMTRLDASYKAKAEQMRLAMQKTVQKQEADMRHSKKSVIGNRDYCKMCDLNFFGTIVNHRKNEMHFQLKTFLHPRCSCCAREFPTRMEWDLHKLTVAHQVREKKREELRVAGAIGVHSEKVESADASSTVVKRPSCVLGVDSTFDPQIAVGMEYLATGQHCKVCELFFERRYDAKSHCMTQEHFDKCLAKAKIAAEVEKEKLEKEALEKKAKESEIKESAVVDLTATDDVAEVAVVKVDSETDDSEGNWKRRRVAETKSDDDDLSKAPLDSESVKGNELYDPLEGDDDVKPVEANSNSPEDILGDLDREIGEILDASADEQGEANGSVDEDAKTTDAKEESPKSTGKARRGGRGGAARGRKRKY